MKTMPLWIFCVIALGGLGVSSAQDVRICWVNANGPGGESLDLRLGGKLMFRSVTPGSMTAWVKISEGMGAFEVRKMSSDKDGDFTTFPLEKGMRILLVTSPIKGGRYRTSAILLENRKMEAGVEVLNALPDRLVKIPEGPHEFVLRAGARRVVTTGKAAIKLSITETGEGFTVGELTFKMRSQEEMGGQWVLVLLPGEEGQVTGLWVGPHGVILSPGERFEKGGHRSEAPKLKFVAKELPEGVGDSIKKGAFDPRAVDWRTVKSKFAWINAIPSDRPVSLMVNGFTAIRRQAYGVPSGFVPWPRGNWEVSARMAGKTTPLARSRFSLAEEGCALLVSAAKGKTDSVLLALPGLEASKGALIRLVNALPIGELAVTAEAASGDVVFADRLQGGGLSEVMELATVGKASATRNEASKKIVKITLSIGGEGGARARTTSLPVATLSKAGGDWVAVFLLDDESRSNLEVFYCRLSDGAIYLESDLSKAPKVEQ